MADISEYIKQLHSANTHHRLHACKKLSEVDDLPEEAILALQRAANSGDPLVADAASKALQIPTEPVPSYPQPTISVPEPAASAPESTTSNLSTNSKTILGFVSAIIALLGTVPGSILLLYVMTILYPGISGCNYPAGFYIFLWFCWPAIAGSLSIFAILMGSSLRRLGDEHKTKGNILVGVALVGLILGLCSAPGWFCVFICPGHY